MDYFGQDEFSNNYQPYLGTPGGYGTYQQYNNPNAPQYQMPQNYAQRPESGADILSGLLKSGAGYNYNQHGVNTAPQQATLGKMQEAADAQYNNDSPLFQQTYNQERDAGNQDLAAAIAEMSRQNRKLGELGRTPLFSPERGGEQMFRQTVQGYQDVQNQARMRARQILGAGQSAQGQVYQAQGNMAQTQDTNNKKQAFGLGNIADAIPLIAKLF